MLRIVTQGNWVVPPVEPTGLRHDGVVCLSRGAFLEGWLLPCLEGFNQGSAYVVDEAFWVSQGLLQPNACTFSYHLGLAEADLKGDPNALSWKPAPKDPNNPNELIYTFEWLSEKDDTRGLWRVNQSGMFSIASARFLAQTAR